METTIEVRIERAYGNVRRYVTSRQAKALQVLTGTQTLTEAHMKALRDMGFNFHEVNMIPRASKHKEQKKVEQAKDKSLDDLIAELDL